MSKRTIKQVATMMLVAVAAVAVAFLASGEHLEIIAKL